MPAYSRILLPWDSQPQEPVGIDWDNPLTRGLVLAWTPAHIVEPTTGVAWLRGRATKAGGIGLSTDPTASGVYYELPAPSSAAAPLASRLDLSALTVACIAQQPTETNTGRAFVRGHGSGTPAWSIGLNGGSFDGPYASFGATTFGPSSGDATMVGRPHVVSMSGDGATAELWYDGRLFTSGAYTPPTYAYDAANHRTWIVGSNGQGAGVGTENYGAFIWNRPLSAEEHKAFHANPWQIFSPRSIWVPVGASAAGGPVSGSLAATESGADVAALAGDVLVSGSLAATESGGDTAALAGTIAVVGALAATESGADTAALQGLLGAGPVTGSIAATESGSDVAALAGLVAIVGTMDAAESGSDTASFRAPSSAQEVYGSTGYWPSPKRKTQREIDDERRRRLGLPVEVLEAVAAAPVERRKVVLADLIGKPKAARITRVDLSEAIALHKRRKRQRDDEMLMLM